MGLPPCSDGPLPTVDLRFLDPVMQRLRRATNLGRNRGHRRPARGVPARVIQNIRTARSRTSGENLFVVLLVMAPSSQELEPPANPGRFNGPEQALTGDHCTNSVICFTAATSDGSYQCKTIGDQKMTVFIRAVSSAFTRTNEECDTLFPVLMFTVVGLLLTICLVLANGAPPLAEFGMF